ncbi:MAG: hypothetical protein GEV11_29115, partial [Streptosporangiales bacterium]|nr:hypothetical protein [Streptosporangiales bacterium]
TGLDGIARRDTDYHHIKQQLDGINTLYARLKLGDEQAKAGTGPPVLLLGFDTQDLGKCIVSFDNPDTADNVVTFVPGFGTTQAGNKLNMQRAELLGDTSRRLARDQTTASIYWYDYRPPQVGNFHRTMFEGLADQAIQPLGGFMRGLEASRTAPKPAHTTLMAHSYGSLAAGKTAVEYPKLADDFILLGSPGVSVDHARDLGVHPSHVFVGAAADDPVARWLPPRDPRELLEAGPTPDLIFGEDGPFGTKPISPDFGAQVFYTESNGHGGYWNRFSKSMENLGRITVVGQEPQAK